VGLRTGWGWTLGGGGEQGFASAQPVTAVVDTVRDLLSDTPVGASAWHAAIWSLGIIAASMLLAGLLFQRRTR
jgi:ABC-2 type transport system permease protein